MSTHLQRLRRRVVSDRDAGMTLPEVLITMVIMGTLMTALVAATTVILRQQDNSVGRLNNSRSEQNVGIWMPSDLASAEGVITDPGASPCAPDCPPNVNVGGSNALMLTWTGSTPGDTEAIPTQHAVSYRYVEVDGEFQLIRVACVRVGGGAPTCDQVVVLRDVLPPPPGQTWIPGVTSPVWVMVVRLALDPADVDGGPDDTVPSDPTYYTKNGRRVTVTINGGGDIAGAGGGEDSITLSAGGTDRKDDLSTSDFSDPPSFGATRSRCGGNFVMAVDTSGSIGSTNMASVRTGILAFIDSFAGTPIKLEIVRFSSTAQSRSAPEPGGAATTTCSSRAMSPTSRHRWPPSLPRVPRTGRTRCSASSRTATAPCRADPARHIDLLHRRYAQLQPPQRVRWHRTGGGRQR
jgi:prepilin-type N-terminal cleavage/methylation domain-containing protein